MTNAELYDNFRRIIQKIRKEGLGLPDTASEVRSLFQRWFSGHQNMETRDLVDRFWPLVDHGWPLHDLDPSNGLYSGQGLFWPILVAMGIPIQATWPWMTPEWLSTEYQPHFWKLISLMHSQAFRWCLWVIDFMVTLLRKPNMKRFVVGGF